ncbi:head GIN domain-containing protein [Undibacterium sp.]|uniref:head GIN domain-containing protein n=1 Tax=Undibacterium sp. TaxID=1914977 RepID=UPI00374D0B44
MRRLFILPLLFTSVFAHADEQVRKLPAFNAINSKGPISIIVQAGKAQTLTASGNEKFLSNLVTEVVNGELMVSLQDKNFKSTSGDPKIIVTMPALRQLKVEGAGETALSNIDGERLDISYQGAGSLKANGKIKWLRLKAQGVGEINTRELKAEHVDVEFEGIGTVKVYASDLLNAVVQGMGSLIYYGNPRTFHKSVEGIGSVSAGK